MQSSKAKITAVGQVIGPDGVVKSEFTLVGDVPEDHPIRPPQPEDQENGSDTPNDSP